VVAWLDESSHNRRRLKWTLILEQREYSPIIYERLSKVGGVADSFTKKIESGCGTIIGTLKNTRSKVIKNFQDNNKMQHHYLNYSSTNKFKNV